MPFELDPYDYKILKIINDKGPITISSLINDLKLHEAIVQTRVEFLTKRNYQSPTHGVKVALLERECVGHEPNIDKDGIFIIGAPIYSDKLFLTKYGKYYYEYNKQHIYDKRVDNILLFVTNLFKRLLGL